MKILIVDDNRVSLKILNNLLSPYGQVEEANSALKAIDTVKSAVEKNAHYDLILLDIIMPHMSGQEVLTAIRNLEKEQGIPDHQRARIVMTTAMTQSDAIHESLHRQADGYLLKPITRKKLAAELKRLYLDNGD